MKRVNQVMSLFGMTLMLSACGGGKGTDSAAPQPCGISCQPTSRILFEPQKSTLPANQNLLGIEFPDSPFATALVVRAFRSDNTPVPENTLVNITTSNVQGLQVGIGELYGGRFDQVCALTSGGIANFLLYSGTAPGQVRVTASFVEPFQPGTRTVDQEQGTVVCTNQFNQAGTRSVAADLIYTIGPGIATAPRIEIVPRRTLLPINTLGVAPFVGSPFLTEVELFRRRSNGEIILNDTVQLSVTPTDIGAVSLPNTAASPNRIADLLSGTPLTISGGRGLFYAHALNRPGRYFITASAVDPDNGRPLQVTREITVGASTSPNPGALTFLFDDSPIYVQGSGGSTSKAIQVFVTDGANTPVADSASNNVLLEIANPGAAGGESLNAIGASGPVQGTSIRAKSVSGILPATFFSGTRQGIITIRATADRADNNVDNGIQNPVSQTGEFVVSDGRLFSLRIVRPTNAVTNTAASVLSVNPVTQDAARLESGAYQMTLTALATDRQGNPVVPGTQIEFGLVDSPLTGYPASGQGTFPISGFDGDPQEGGTLFSAPGGAFTTAGGGAGPGDTLVVFGQDITGNRDLESARTVQRINSAGSLNTTVRFNFNDDTGVSVNNGPVLPYIIGRATVANIQPNAVAVPPTGGNAGAPVRVTTNAQGLATTFINYPVNQINRRAVVWARGSGDLVNGSPELVTDAAAVVFSGLGNTIRLIASPTTIRGNKTADVRLCTFDSAGTPLPGSVISFTFGANAGRGLVDGVLNSGRVLAATGEEGCTTARVETSGLLAATSVVFTAGVGATTATATVQITLTGTNILQAIPSELFGTGGQVLLRLLDQEGSPVVGVQLNGACSLGTTGGMGTNFRLNVTVPPGVTNNAGETNATIVSSLDGFGTSAVGTCTFTGGGGGSAIVTVRGTDLCVVNPTDPRCPTP